MTERPILFSAPMIRALLAGTKTQTRRLVTAGRSLVDGRGVRAWPHLDFDGSEWVDNGPSPAGNPGPYLKVANIDGERRHRVYSRIQVGDTLWVKETFYCDDITARTKPGTPAEVEAWRADTYYRADVPSGRLADAGYFTDCEAGKWTPSIHMPRWASRISLRVTSVRVERVQAISEEDARAEGVERAGGFMASAGCWTNYAAHGPSKYTARDSFESLWVSINGAESWDANPWVWCVGFERVEAAHG